MYCKIPISWRLSSTAKRIMIWFEFMIFPSKNILRTRILNELKISCSFSLINILGRNFLVSTLVTSSCPMTFCCCQQKEVVYFYFSLRSLEWLQYIIVIIVFHEYARKRYCAITTETKQSIFLLNKKKISIQPFLYITSKRSNGG